MYEWLKQTILPLLKIEAKPQPPAAQQRHQSVQTIRACPAYLHYKLFFWKLYAVAWGLGILVASTLVLLVDSRFILLVIPLIAIAVFKAAVLYVVTRLDYEMRWYVITERSLLVRQGVWIVREITLTFANAQNVRVTQGPLQRWFGFSHVEVDTAGGGGAKENQTVQAHRAVLRGLDKPEKVRDLILEIIKQHRTAGLGDPEERSRLPQPSSKLNASLVTEIWKETQQLRKVLEN